MFVPIEPFFEKLQLWQTSNFNIVFFFSNCGILLNRKRCHLLIIVAGIKLAWNIISGDVVSKKKYSFIKSSKTNIFIRFLIDLAQCDYFFIFPT